MKKIIYLCEQLNDKGGAEVSTLLLLKQLKSKYEIKKYVVKTELFNKLPMNIAQISKTIFWYFKIKNIIKTEKPDMIITQLGPTTTTVLLAKHFKIPVLIFIRDFWFLMYDKSEYYRLVNHKPPLFKKIPNYIDEIFAYANKKLIKNALEYSTVISNSKYISQLLYQHLLIESTILNPCLPKEIYSKPNIKLKYNTKNILFVGRIANTKGLKIIIKAMKNINALLTIVGKKEGNYYNSCVDLVHQLNIEKKIIFVDEVKFEEIKKYYESASCVVVPSIWNEPFGRTAIEAMSTGTPVISSNRGNLIHLCKNQIVLEPKPILFSKAINNLLNDYDYYQSLCSVAELESKKYLLNSQIKILKNLIENKI